MIKIGVVGASGRTGRCVVEALLNHDQACLYAAVVSQSSSSLGGEIKGTSVRYTAGLDSLSGSDLVIEFSNPETSIEVAAWCAESGVPVLLATTGHSDEQRSGISELAKRIALGLTPNTSIGAAVITTLASEAKRLLGDSFDIEVLDLHHRMKRDAPSGTAKAIIGPLVDDEQVVFGRHGQRRPGEVGVVALRGGDVVGDHTIYFLGNGERVELTHRVSTRAVFGQGAVSLALKLIGLPKGLYSAGQLLGVRLSSK